LFLLFDLEILLVYPYSVSSYTNDIYGLAIMMIFFVLLPFYAILRSIPNKLVGVIAMFAAILALLLLPLTDVSRSRGMQFRPLSKMVF